MEKKTDELNNLSTLRTSLPYGSRKIIAERTGKSQYYVTRVLLGIYNPDIEVIKAALDYYIEYQAEQKRLNSEIGLVIQR